MWLLGRRPDYISHSSGRDSSESLRCSQSRSSSELVTYASKIQPLTFISIASNLIQHSYRICSSNSDSKNKSDSESKKESELYISKNNFDEFWQFYTPIAGRDGTFTSKGSKVDATKAYEKAIKKFSHEQIMQCLKVYLTFKHIYQQNNVKFDWYLKADDDT